jgi:tRNA G18 (ribose-2'-O)-methylase SpoU
MEIQERIYNYFSDTRNVVDEFKGLPNERIKAIIKSRTLPFSVAMQHIEHDFNLGSVFRNANSFGAKEIFYVGGKKNWDRRAACGVMNYSDITFLRTMEEFAPLKERYFIVGLDNLPSALPIETFEYPDKPVLFVLGEEKNGLTFEMLSLCDVLLAIKQRGSVRSLNAGVASGIAMYDFCTKYELKNNGSS